MTASLIKQYCGQALGNAAPHPVQDAPHPRLDITSRGDAPIPPSRGCRGPNRPRFRPVGSNQTHGICAGRVNDLLVWLFRPWLACSRVRPGKFTPISHGLSSLRRSMYTSYSSVENRLRIARVAHKGFAIPFWVTWKFPQKVVPLGTVFIVILF